MRFKLIPNPRKSWSGKLAKEVATYLEKHGHKQVKRKADVTVCIGGDGTVLYANHQKRLEGTVIGIGTKGSYICQLTREDWRGITRLLGERKVGIMTLEAREGRQTFSALNDFVFHTSDYRVMEMEVSAGGKPKSFLGDGIIISSALGSTAYAYSAGGRALKATERKMSIVPICPYRRAFKPLALEGGEEVTIRVGSGCAFIIDGIFVRHLRKGQTVHLKKGSDVKFFEGVGAYK